MLRNLFLKNKVYRNFKDNIFFNAIFSKYEDLALRKMDYKKKSLNNMKSNESYEEIDTRLASGWYVDSLSKRNKVKKYKTKEVSFKISKKSF